MTRIGRLSASGLAAGALALGAAGPASAFTNFELGAQPLAVPGQSCPATGTAEQACTNGAAEPAIRAAGDGSFYGASENGLGGGTDAWRSPAAANGQSFTYLGVPDAGVPQATNATGFAPGGGDTDVAVAPTRNASGEFNVYVASLSLANVDVSTSTDGGRTFALNPVSATVPVDDREWIAADGASKVCISYHDIATSNIDVNCSTDAGRTFTQLGEAIDPAHAYLVGNNELGNLTIDPASHTIYQVIAGIGANDATCAGCGYHDLYMAVSTDGGQTFTDHLILDGPAAATYDHNFPNVTVDQAGNVYAVASDNHAVRFSASTDRGASWTTPTTVSRAPAATAIYPWATAGSGGHLAIVYYGSSYSQPGQVPDTFPASAPWNVYYAENDHALTSPAAFSQTQASPVNHTGAVCEGGVTCSGNRDLYDDFGVAVSPTTNTAAIIYSDDQYGGAVNPPPANCTAVANDTASCDHTNIAVGPSSLFAATATGTGAHRQRQRRR